MKEKIKQLSYRHVDVFSKTPLSGNGLTVFTNCDGLSAEAMQKITQEMRQYESIFLFSTAEAHRFLARIFTMEEELDFAGHPILGAACVLHEQVRHEERKIIVKVAGTPNHMHSVEVKGEVCMVANEVFDGFEI